MISLRAVSKRYASGPPAVAGLSLEVDEGELCVLVGPSGCGKTTTLKMVNRLIEPSSGEILIGGRRVHDTDPVELRRRIGYVMQQGGLFPHQRVADNVATVPRLLGWSKERTRQRTEELLALVGLDPAAYGRRYPHELSGGERQRVGVARALGGDPPVLLMDEPFGAVDPVTRRRLQEEFRQLHGQLNKTVMLVTHDIEEAATLGTRLAVLSAGGVLEQHGTPAEVLSRPASPFVSDFVGAERGLHRLGVTQVAREDLTRVPLVAGTAPFAQVNELMHGTGSRFALVLDGAEQPVGWVAREDQGSGGPGAVPPVGDTVGDRLVAFHGSVELGASLKEALATLLQHDDGFVVVLEGKRYVGVLTPDDVHAAMRRAAGPSAGAPPA